MMDPNVDRHLETLGKTAPPDGLDQRLARVIPDEVAPVRPVPSAVISAILLFLLLLTATVLPGFAAGGKGWKVLDFAQRSWIAAALGTAIIWLSVELSKRMIPGARLSVPASASALTTLAFSWLWAFGATGFGPKPILFYAACVGFTSASVLLGSILAITFLRRGFVTAPGMAWLIAAASGAAGFGAVQIFCPILETAHILTSHVLPATVVGALAGVAARRYLTRRASRT